MGLCPLNYIRACAFPLISAHIHALCRGRYWTEFRRDLSLHPSLHHCENKLMECPGYRKDKNRKTLKNAGETPCLCETQCCSTHKNAGKTSMCPNPVHTVLKILKGSLLLQPQVLIWGKRVTLQNPNLPKRNLSTSGVHLQTQP